MFRTTRRILSSSVRLPASRVWTRPFSQKTRQTTKEVVVTGATSGIGKYTATVLAESGYRVTAIGRNVNVLNTLKNLFPHNIIPLPADLTKTTSFDFIRQHFQPNTRIDYVINAAASAEPFASLMEAPLVDITNCIWLNAIAPLALLQCLLPYFREGSRYLSLGSSYVDSSTTFDSHLAGSYAMGKAANDMAIKYLRSETCGKPMVGYLNPGATQTPMYEKFIQALRERNISPEDWKPTDPTQIAVFIKDVLEKTSDHKYTSTNWEFENTSHREYLKTGSLFAVDKTSILACFPGGKDELLKIIKLKNKNYSLPLNEVLAVKFIVTNNILNEEQLIAWRNEIQKLCHFETDKTLIAIIGLLTLHTKEINHIGYVIDGDRRWAQQQNIPHNKTHQKAFVEVMPAMSKTLFEHGIHTFSIWYFKEQNLFTRRKEEIIDSILKYMSDALDVYFNLANKMNIRIFHIGRKEIQHPDPDIQRCFNQLMKKFKEIEEATSVYTKHHLILGANYDRDDDLLRSIQKIFQNKIDPNQLKAKDLITFTDMGTQLYPTPDLVIRSAMPEGGGRTGAFLPNTSETCFYFHPESCPELTWDHILSGAAKFAHPLVRYKSAMHFKDGKTMQTTPTTESVVQKNLSPCKPK